MPIQSVNLSSQIAAALESGDVGTMQQAVRASVKDQLASNAKQSLIAAKWKLESLATLTRIRDKLTVLPTTSDGRCIVSSSLNAEIVATGLPVTTTTCCQISIGGNTKHLATPQEMATAAAAAPYFGPDAATGLEIRKATNSSGAETTYFLYHNEATITASKTDVQNMVASIGTELKARALDASRAMREVQFFRDVVKQQDTQTTDEQRRKGTTEDRQRNEYVQAAIAARHKQDKP